MRAIWRASCSAKLLVVAASLLMGLSASVAVAVELPASIKALQAKGLSSPEEFSVSHDVRGFAAIAQGQPVAVYVTSDGQTIVGTRITPDGQPADEEALMRLVAKPLAKQSWEHLGNTHWIADGKPDANRVVYVFTDPNCPYCHRFWQAARPWVDSGKVQLRHILVGIIKEDSPAKAAAILSASDPAKAFRENEENQEHGGVAPLKTIPVEYQKIMATHQAFMGELGFQGTPGIIVLSDQGLLEQYNGMPQASQLLEVLGPR
jgi:thiol:disulfide interchange protein DsbG